VENIGGNSTSSEYYVAVSLGMCVRLNVVYRMRSYITTNARPVCTICVIGGHCTRIQDVANSLTDNYRGLNSRFVILSAP